MRLATHLAALIVYISIFGSTTLADSIDTDLARALDPLASECLLGCIDL